MLSLIVPATDRPAALPRCLAAASRARSGPDEVIVVEQPADAGPAQARNDGAQRARGDLLVFVDADVEVHPDAFARIRAAFAADAALDAVFGAYDDTPEAPGAVSRFRNLLHHHVHASAAGPATTFWGGLGAVRRRSFRAVGGFDADRYPSASIEDIDLGARLTTAGGRIVLDPEILGTHLKAWTLRSMLVTDVRRRGAPWVALLLRERAALSTQALNLGWRHRASAALSLLATAAAVRRRPGACAGAVAGLLALNRDFYGLLARRQGRRAAALGVGLHVLHHLAGVAAVPAGVVLHLRERGHSVPGATHADTAPVSLERPSHSPPGTTGEAGGVHVDSTGP